MPNFAAWDRQLLDKFAAEAYLRLQQQEEALEQLRALWHGYRIAVHVTHTAPGAGVDTPEDLERVRAWVAQHP